MKDYRNLDRRGLTLMVGHTFVYSPPVRMIKDLIDKDELGEIYYAAVYDVALNEDEVASNAAVLAATTSQATRKTPPSAVAHACSSRARPST